MKAVILTGGKGKRLLPLTDQTAKGMVEIAGKPVLQHQIEALRRFGIFEFHMLTGYCAAGISEYFGDGNSFGVKIRYTQEHGPLGTAGAVKQLEDVVKEDFFLVYGDLIFNLKFDDLVAFHFQKKRTATLVVQPTDHPQDSDLLSMDDQGKITEIFNKPHTNGFRGNLANAALYVLSPAIFSHIPSKGKSDFMKDVFPGMLRRSVPVYGYRTAEYIKDMGTSERLGRVTSDLESADSLCLSKESPRPAVYLDRDGTLIKDKYLLHQSAEIELLPRVEDALRNLNHSIYLSILVADQSAVARNFGKISMGNKIHRKLEALLGIEGAYLDDIIFDPHHPDSPNQRGTQKERRASLCRKPNTGLIERAAHRHNIDLNASWMIGDTTTDIATGIAAGMKTALVRTGKGGRDGKYRVEPDYVFNDLYEASLFILKKRIKPG